MRRQTLKGQGVATMLLLTPTPDQSEPLTLQPEHSPPARRFCAALATWWRDRETLRPAGKLKLKACGSATSSMTTLAPPGHSACSASLQSYEQTILKRVSCFMRRSRPAEPAVILS